MSGNYSSNIVQFRHLSCFALSIHVLTRCKTTLINLFIPLSLSQYNTKVYYWHVLKPETPKRNHRSETTVTTQKQPKQKNDVSLTLLILEMSCHSVSVISSFLFRWLQSFRFDGFVLAFHVLEHAFIIVDLLMWALPVKACCQTSHARITCLLQHCVHVRQFTLHLRLFSSIFLFPVRSTNEFGDSENFDGFFPLNNRTN